MSGERRMVTDSIESRGVSRVRLKATEAISILHAVVVSSSAILASAATAAPPVDLADVADGNRGFVMNGINQDDSSGSCVSGAGDVNGDGYRDLVICAPGAAETYVVFGKPGADPIELGAIHDGDGGFVIRGTGFSVSGAGDVNGDGLRDLIVGAWRANGGAGSRPEAR